MKATPFLLALALVAGAPAVSAAPLDVQSFAGGRYVTGGVGDDEQAQLRELQRDFNLRLVTAQREGDYIANADVTILRGDQTVLEATMRGPVLLAKLEPGTYRLHAVVDGRPQERTVEVRSGILQNVLMHWDIEGS
ncbi:carboxypeptidase regulatory-like domain-containing protein [Desertibaculum subflavum]|uniref:carboxypeptidase regulatory-like domain-containing protein n=1 Tax=Desertibaculum subflavum TaxID=2268458 RepID=UPI000E663126